MRHFHFTLILGMILIFAGNVSAETITVNDDENTPSWGEQITVQEGTSLSPVYWGEGFSIQEITETVQVLDYQTQESILIEDSGSNTLYQDFVINVCTIEGESADVIITRSTEDIESLCGDSVESHDYGESISVSESDEIVFGPGNANSLEVNSIREDNSNDDSSFFEFTTGQGTEKRIVYVESRESGRIEEVEFETGMATVFVEELLTSEKEAVIRIERELSQSSNFECSQANLEENQYAFCSQDGDTAVQNIDLGHTSKELEYRYNNRAYGSGEEVAATFTDSDGMTLTVTQRGLNYKQADIDVVEWRGLRQEHNGARQQVIIEVDPVETPEASIDVNENSLTIGESFNADFESFSPGLYRLEVEGAGISRETNFDESQESQTLDFTPESLGEIRLNLIAPGNWWNPLDSDKIIDEEAVNVEERDSSREEYSFGEKFRLSEGESTTVEGRNFYLSALGSDVVSWRPERSSSSNSNIRLLDDPTRMGFKYSDRFDGYGYLCSVSSEEASIVVESEEKNPWDVCNKHPSELRDSSSDYEFKDYDLGEKTKVSSKKGLKFGESRVYIEDISKSGGGWKVDGYKEWEKQTTDYSTGPINYSSTSYFYEGDIASALCDVSQGEAEIVLEKVDDVESGWPQSHCIDEEPDNSENLEITQAPDTPSWGDEFNASSGETVSPVYWGEGFELISSSSDTLEIRDLRTDEAISIETGEAHTLYQDYVLHHCSTVDRVSNMIVTRGSEDTSKICPEETKQSESDITVNELQSTPSWGDNIEVSEGTTISPVYWGEGFTVESMRDGRVNIVSMNGERDVSIGEGNMRTFYQDYVIHACTVENGEGIISITTGRESHKEACGEVSSSNSIEANIGTEENNLAISGNMEVPNPCYGTEASEFNLEGENIKVFIEPVKEDSRAFCPSVVSEASIDLSEELDPGVYNVNLVVAEKDGNRKEFEKEIEITGEAPELEVKVRPEDPSLTDKIILSAGPESYSYEWDTNGDSEFEREGSRITMKYERAGSKSVTVRTKENLPENVRKVDFEVSNPDIDSSITVSKDEITLAEPLLMNYSVGEAVSRNGYRLEVKNPNGDTLMEKSETSRSGSERFIPGNDAVTGTYNARLVANEGFLSSIFRTIFGPEAEASFEVIDDSESVSAWRSYCDEKGYDHETASGRVSCIEEEIGPDCFTSNPSSECREIAETVCQYYRGTSFDAENGRCN